MDKKKEDREPILPRASFGELLGQLVNNAVAVLRDEIALIIQNSREKAGAVRRALLLLALGTIISFAAFLCLCAALIVALTSFMALQLAALVVATVLALGGVLISFVGYRLLKI